MTSKDLDRYCTNAKNVGRVVLYVPPHAGKIKTPTTFALIPEPRRSRKSRGTR